MMQKRLNAYASALRNAQDELAVKYQPALRAMAFRLKERLPASVDVNDLIGVGTEELIKLARRYDDLQNDNFWGYARKRVYGSMLDFLRSLDTLSRSNRKIVKDIEKIINDYINDFDEEPSDEYLASELGIDIDKIKEARLAQSISYIVPLDEQLQVLSDEDANERLDKENLLEKITEVLEELNEREQLIIQLYFYEELSLKEISEILQISESRVSQLQSRVINTLRKRLIDG
ncbi:MULTISPECIES: RNA polymerase sigma factor FliA [unclassified Campylobacter]|uniref:RNA polymerase sigma factor FliA n=2 Tax=unclassified Campylobacter TaxID=2593542 RepID=UPI001BDA8E17|nr:RNA polymerase sigma factor FliA [Campylobacter sp. RM12651]MBT0880000.1 RNA polymerase sigma factor FliA [Campylobacter sp. 2018MI27]MBT0882055.1 RNA polymerase sigma factor FliA [Campylobacter sp. 2018MI13]MBT0884475.1 RNA polymerase sigma factor FliA [Campylobacter sp. 2018MI10]MBZ7978335.1 RNA polymerase sigma factor FliA [Campylobacter sp. RM12654]MBZ7981344.1 RNA polymerase sigma factor FliA [Campylobacter sp. RM12640]MBZ7984005.1 RNA polymerase sigma factor FliA [Campylobacter sp. R